MDVDEKEQWLKDFAMGINMEIKFGINTVSPIKPQVKIEALELSLNVVAQEVINNTTAITALQVSVEALEARVVALENRTTVPYWHVTETLIIPTS